MNSQAWRSEALCVGLDTTLFYPEGKGKKAGGLTLCQRCPVRVDCLEYVMEAQISAEDYGVWGGTTPKQRRKLRSQQKVWSREELEVEIERIDSERKRIFAEDGSQQDVKVPA